MVDCASGLMFVTVDLNMKAPPVSRVRPVPAWLMGKTIFYTHKVNKKINTGFTLLMPYDKIYLTIP